LLRSARRSADREIKLLGELLMKKHLIAAAVAAAVAVPAMAQNVELYGVYSGAYTTGETKTTTAAGVTTSVKTVDSVRQNGQYAGSRLGFRGTEDLGGGLKASFNLEFALDAPTGLNDANNRQQWIQLAGNFGSVRLGRTDALSRNLYNGFTAHANSGFAPGNLGSSIALVVPAATNPFAANGAGLGGALPTFGQRAASTGAPAANADGINTAINDGVTQGITYTTPSFSGFNAQLQYSNDSSDASATVSKDLVKMQNVGLNYSQGPLAVSLASETMKSSLEGTAASQYERDTMMLGARYNFGVAQVFGTYVDRTLKYSGVTNIDYKITEVGVSVPVQNFIFTGSYGDGKAERAGVQSVDIGGYQLGAHYLLSKRTRAFLLMGESEAKQGTAKVAVDGWTLGLQHSF
jgi:predicted porin